MSGVFAVPQNLKKKNKKSKSGSGSGAPIVLELSFDSESGLYSLDFAGKKCILYCFIRYIDPEIKKP